MIKNWPGLGDSSMWYRKSTLEEEQAATALLRAQVNLFTHPLRPLSEETAEDKKIHEENLLHLLANIDEGSYESCC
jgi:hypothetical protein